MWSYLVGLIVALGYVVLPLIAIMGLGVFLGWYYVSKAGTVKRKVSAVQDGEALHETEVVTQDHPSTILASVTTPDGNKRGVSFSTPHDERQARYNKEVSITILILTISCTVCYTGYVIYFMSCFAANICVKGQDSSWFVTLAYIICWVMPMVNALLTPIVILVRGRHVRQYVCKHLGMKRRGQFAAPWSIALIETV